MIELIDTIFFPILNWLATIKNYILEISVPASRPFDISKYLGPFALLGPYWIGFITTICSLAFIYMVVFIINSSSGLYQKFKDAVQWW